MSRDPRPPIPQEMQRSVRQRCGFGCVICGIPLYQYDHMTEWSEVQEHTEPNLTLLCEQHHAEKTKGLMPVETVRRADSDPFNLRAGVTSPYRLHYSGDSATVVIGSNEFTTSGQSMAAIMIDGVPLVVFNFEDDHCLLSAQFFDEMNHLVLVIDQNELVHSTSLWDVKFVGTTLTIRAKARDIFLEVRFAPPRIEISRGRLLLNGVPVTIKDGVVSIRDLATISGNRGVNCPVGLNLGVDPVGYPSGISFSHIDRYGTCS